MIIGIDIGSTITKAVSVVAGRVEKKVKTRAIDAVTSATGAFGKMLVENGIGIRDIEKIVITGVGAAKIDGSIFGIPTAKIDEITAVGIGGMFQVGRPHIIIANIGTGTALVEAKNGAVSHLGGSGVGGGTILGLAKRLISLSSFSDIMETASKGDLRQVDLLLEDIMPGGMSFLDKNATAANFGKTLDTARNEDIALAILNMVYQVIGMLSVFAARGKGMDTVVVTGSGSDNPIGKAVFAAVSGMYGIRFEHPAGAQYTTAIGAGLSGM
ncbi:MAG: type II pantothenate kinase [Treponematales bacterium]